jgi:hypothetical protein
VYVALLVASQDNRCVYAAWPCQEVVEREQAQREAKLVAARDACKERGIVIGQPVFKSFRRTNAIPYIDEVTSRRP